MATVAAVIASTHHPFYYRASTWLTFTDPEPLAFQREYAARLAHWSLPYPDIST